MFTCGQLFNAPLYLLGHGSVAESIGYDLGYTYPETLFTSVLDWVGATSYPSASVMVLQPRVCVLTSLSLSFTLCLNMHIPVHAHIPAHPPACPPHNRSQVKQNPREIVTIMLIATHGNTYPGYAAVVARMNASGLLDRVWNHDPGATLLRYIPQAILLAIVRTTFLARCW